MKGPCWRCSPGGDDTKLCELSFTDACFDSLTLLFALVENIALKTCA